MLEYNLYKSKEDLESTAYLEIGPGPYTGKHWQKGYTFISEQSFIFIEGIIEKYFPEYDHYDMNNIPKGAIEKIIKNLEDVSENIPEMDYQEIENALGLKNSFGSKHESEIMENKEDIRKFIKNVYLDLKLHTINADEICILGI